MNSFILKNVIPFLLAFNISNSAFSQMTQNKKDYALTPECTVNLIKNSFINNQVIGNFLEIIEESKEALEFCSEKFTSVSKLYVRGVDAIQKSTIDCGNTEELELLYKIDLEDTDAFSLVDIIKDRERSSFITLNLDNIKTQSRKSNLLTYTHELLHVGKLDNRKRWFHNRPSLNFTTDRIYMLSQACINTYMENQEITNNLNNKPDSNDFEIFEDNKNRVFSKQRCIRALTMKPAAHLSLSPSQLEELHISREQAKEFCHSIMP